MIEEKTGREATVTELKQIYRLLFDDVTQAEEIFSVSPSEFANRTFVRTYFAYVEGVAYQLRQVTLASLDGLGVLSAKETAILKEQKYKPQENGEAKPVPAFQGMADSLKFTLRCYAKNHGINDYEPKLGKGWDSMLAAIKIRDRFMHPKSVASLSLTPAEVIRIDEARKWWHESVTELLVACEQQDERIRQLSGAS